MKLIKASIALVVAMIAGAGVAYADSGQFVRYSCYLVFYYGASSGNANSNTCGGGYSTKLCADAPGATSTNTFAAELWEQRDFAPDYRRSWTPQLQYNWAAHCQAPVSLRAGYRHYVHVGWSYASGAGSAANGYGRTQTP
jgi:hypothetical protein